MTHSTNLNGKKVPSNIKNEQVKLLVDTLLSCDDPKHLLSNLTDMYVAYNTSDFSDYQEERQSKSYTYLSLVAFLGGLKSL